MSFFGFDTNLPKDRGHATNAPGFGAPRDAFAAFSGGAGPDDDIIDFEETYDGLGDQLDERDDAFNDDTFGGGPATQQAVGKDFDFAGKTSQIANTLQEEQMLFEARNQRKAPAPQVRQAQKPARTGYENYHDPTYIPQLEARADIWGLPPKQSAPAKQPEPQARQPVPAQSRKIMNVEEVEAMMRQQPGAHPNAGPPRQHTPAQGPPMPAQYQQQYEQMQHMQRMQQMQQMQQQMHQQQQFQQHPQHQQFPHQPPFSGMGMPGQFAPPIMHRPQQYSPQPPPGMRNSPVHAELPGQPVHAQSPRQPAQPTILQRQRPMQENAAPQQQRPTPDAAPQQQSQAPPQPNIQRPSSQPRHILQNPNRLSGQGQPMAQPGPGLRGPAPGPQGPPGHGRGPSIPGMVITHPQQLLNLSEEERAAFLEEDAKRAKRNHKIALLSKDNGLMTPQDKNFITRIQLQQLMAATGNLEEAGSEAALAEDFYYQVFAQIRGASRTAPNQPANLFAQTYLFQTNSRYGRRNGRGGDNHMQRMEQQVQRAVEAAKAKPKGRQLVIEGSLGKIAFSNSKTPRPLLNIKRTQTDDKHPKHHKPSIADRKVILRDIENVYMTLMHMEDHERALPAPINEDSPPEAIQKHMEWRTKIDALHNELWENTKIMVPINPSSRTLHPFIAILSHAKGKKLIPRLFRHLTDQERITLVTIVVVHLETLPVVSHAIATPDEPLSSAMREEVELFSHTVMPPLIGHISESPLNIIIGLLGLILERTNLHVVARTKIGMNLLMLLVSRAELLKNSAPEINVVDWENWTELYNRLFDAVEPVLPVLFPGTANDTGDSYVWQFLAAMGAGASPEQQQRLVLGVKDRVLETVGVSKILPADMAAERLATVNLFMIAIGLDVELLG